MPLHTSSLICIQCTCTETAENFIIWPAITEARKNSGADLGTTCTVHFKNQVDVFKGFTKIPQYTYLNL